MQDIVPTAHKGHPIVIVGNIMVFKESRLLSTSANAPHPPASVPASKCSLQLTFHSTHADLALQAGSHRNQQH